MRLDSTFPNLCRAAPTLRGGICAQATLSLQAPLRLIKFAVKCRAWRGRGGDIEEKLLLLFLSRYYPQGHHSYGNDTDMLCQILLTEISSSNHSKSCMY